MDRKLHDTLVRLSIDERLSPEFREACRVELGDKERESAGEGTGSTGGNAVKIDELEIDIRVYNALTKALGFRTIGDVMAFDFGPFGLQAIRGLGPVNAAHAADVISSAVRSYLLGNTREAGRGMAASPNVVPPSPLNPSHWSLSRPW